MSEQLARQILRQGEQVELAAGQGVSWLVAMAEPVLQGLADPETTTFTVLPPVKSTYDQYDENELAHQDGSDSDDVEIDESFLSNSVVTPQRSLPSSPAAKGTPGSRLPKRRVELALQALGHRISIASLVPQPEADEDEEARVYLRSRELARCGLFSGDWALLEGSESGDRRLVRVFVADDQLSRAEA